MSGRNAPHLDADSEPSRLQDVLDLRLRDRKGLSLERFVADRRYIGRSHAEIAFELWSITDRQVSHETVRRWATDWGIK